ncbi:lipase member H-like [Onthophagus taurus]|uniref:lipase member H-like n=1 Tax=Onthophagus taurus TaxID=166361 RepID=UPI000C200BF1|nr:lipase member H-like [Onthophagus taurus]
MVLGQGTKIVVLFSVLTATVQLDAICNLRVILPWLCDEEFSIGDSPISRLILGEKDINSAILELVQDVVSFTLYSRSNEAGINFITSTVSSINIDSSKETKFLIHGWSNDGNSRMPQTLKDSYLPSKDVNVIVVDWSGLSNLLLYPLPANGTGYIGECLSNIIEELFPNTEKLNVHILGHSLGAHIAGFAGRSLKRKGFILPRITGLDPASPLIWNGLVKSDAEFVDVVHTAAGSLGKTGPQGHIDFYPNGGVSPQPGCEEETFINILFCSHARSWQYYAKTIQNPRRYIAVQCDSYEDYLINRCSGNNMLYMGEYLSSRSRGIYYLNAKLN